MRNYFASVEARKIQESLPVGLACRLATSAGENRNRPPQREFNCRFRLLPVSSKTLRRTHHLGAFSFSPKFPANDFST
ncbi:MAG: hypothetical protein ACE5JC_01105 [Candidatus Zixiibacteriota bacterium]